MDDLIGGTIGKILREEQKDLYESIKNESNWAVINGQVKHDKDLNYMCNLIGIIQVFMEIGAIAVLDLQTFTLYSAKEWKDKIFLKEFSSYSHVKILLSKIDNGYIWVHTRGLRKFGRPVISIEK